MNGWGGRRDGAGRKRSDRGHLTCANPACGRTVPRRRASQMFCSRGCVPRASGPRGGAIHQPRACAMCGTQFFSAVCSQQFCGLPCARAWQIRNLTDDMKAERLRERRRLTCAVRRARRNGGRMPVRAWRHVCDRYGYVCWLCGTPIDATLQAPDDPRGPSVDHVVPLVLGGSDDLSNLRPAHFSCNSRRGGYLVASLKRGGGRAA